MREAVGFGGDGMNNSAEQLPSSMRDDKTPSDVIIRDEAREPVMDPTLGIGVQVAAEGTPRYRLVTIGDSLTQGFQSGAIYNTDISYPAIIAYEMGWSSHFRRPHYLSEPAGGIPAPVNLEFLVRHLEEASHSDVKWWEIDSAGAIEYMLQLRRWWTQGAGVQLPSREEGINHNLAIYGWDLRDTLSINADLCKARMKEQNNPMLWLLKNPVLRLLKPLFTLLLNAVLGQLFLEHHNERAALQVLESARNENGEALTPLQAAAVLGAEGPIENPAGASRDDGDGIETLIVWLGSNNGLPSIINLKVSWSNKEGFDDLEQKEAFTVWDPSDFEIELQRVVNEVKTIRARHVIWLTVPHVTIAPIARGVRGKLPKRTEEGKNSRYFRYYTRPWINEQDFDPDNDPCITEQEARAIDSAIDQYNDAITKAVRVAREEGRDWYLFDAAGLLDRLAQRRYIEDKKARPSWWEKHGGEYKLPLELASLKRPPNAHFFASDPDGRTDGGLFSLDGVHPTTIGYGIVAQELIKVMRLAGVKFYESDSQTERTDPVEVDFRRLIKLDTLISSPPRSVTYDMGLVGWGNRSLDTIIRGFKGLGRFGKDLDG